MRPYDVIKKKRDGLALTDAEIREFIAGYVAGEIPDYQAAAFCMAVYFRGMNPEETASLTLAIRDSGDTLHFFIIDQDKISTTFLPSPVQPLKFSSCGIYRRISVYSYLSQQGWK